MFALIMSIWCFHFLYDHSNLYHWDFEDTYDRSCQPSLLEVSPTTPYFDENAEALGKLIPRPTATKSPPPVPVARVARPLMQADVPKPRCSSPIHEPPAKKVRVNTEERVSRIVAPTPSKASPYVTTFTRPSVARSLSTELDSVSPSKRTIHPQSSLVFGDTFPDLPPLFAPTPSAAPTTPRESLDGDPWIESCARFCMSYCPKEPSFFEGCLGWWWFQKT